MNGGAGSGERFYRRLMAVYPREYRSQHGEEMLGILVDEGAAASARFRLREALALLRHGGGLRLSAWRTTWRGRDTLLGPALVGVLALMGLQSMLATALWTTGWGSPPGIAADTWVWADHAGRST